MKIRLLFLVLALLLAPVYGQWTITRGDFDKYKIDFYQFKPALLSQKGDTFVGYEFMDIENRRKGLVYGLRIFRFKPEGKYTVDTVLLPIAFVVSLAFTDQEKSLIVVGNYGTKILKVNMQTLQFETIFQAQTGKPGFRTDTLVVSWANRVFLSGYFYDKDQYWIKDAVVELRMAEKDVKFIETVNLTELYQKFKTQPRIMYIASGDAVYFAYLKPFKSLTEEDKRKGAMLLVCYNKGELITVDRGLAIGNFAGNGDRVFYSILKDAKTRRTYVKSFEDNQVWEVGEKDVSYTYPFISSDSKTMVYCTVSALDQKMNVYFARESDNFKQKEILHEVPVGPMKISGDGKLYLLMNPEGFTVDYIK